MQAIMLAAGMGSRLGKYTKNNTKCLLNVNGKTLLERAIDSLLEANVNKLILVLGYKKENVKKFIDEKKLNKKVNIEYVDNDIYDKTNNIYSLYLARKYLLQDDTILLESDLIYDHNIINDLVKSEYADCAVIAKYEQWMDGTMVTLQKNIVSSFVEKKDFDINNVDNYYKTVNIYKFSKVFSKRFYVPFLQTYIKTYGNNDYYELVLKVISGLKEANLYGFVIDKKWYEIDDAQDYNIAKTIFSNNSSEKLASFHKRFGGYWRFNGMLDYCYLVNPYFPTKQMLDKMKYFYDELLFNYPSGQMVQRICASRLFNNVSESNILVGNGAAELINQLKYVVGENIALTVPAFNEYIRCFDNCKISYIYSKENNFKLSFEKIKKMLDIVDSVIIVSPDNPSGSQLSYTEIIDLLNYAKIKNKKIILDESFGDFSDFRFTLFDDDILNKYPNLIAIKSVSKSYGVPGLRLGILGCSDQNVINLINAKLPIWNINSFAEYFLQIISIYKKDYINACNTIANERNIFYEKLNTIEDIFVYKSQANYFMIKLNKGNAQVLAEYLLNNYNILIKVLTNKNGFDNGEYIRIAIKNNKENNYLFECIKHYYESEIL